MAHEQIFELLFSIAYLVGR